MIESIPSEYCLTTIVSLTTKNAASPEDFKVSSNINILVLREEPPQHQPPCSFITYLVKSITSLGIYYHHY